MCICPTAFSATCLAGLADIMNSGSVIFDLTIWASFSATSGAHISLSSNATGPSPEISQSMSGSGSGRLSIESRLMSRQERLANSSNARRSTNAFSLAPLDPIAQSPASTRGGIVTPLPHTRDDIAAARERGRQPVRPALDPETVSAARKLRSLHAARSSGKTARDWPGNGLQNRRRSAQRTVLLP